MKTMDDSRYWAWGRNRDGTPYATGMTVAELRKVLERFRNDAEVCVVVCRKRDWNSGGLPGKLKEVEQGAANQIWLKARVLDESLE